MHSISANNSNLFRVAAVLVIAAITITILILGKSFLIPLAWSLLIGLASFRMLKRYEKKYHIKRLFSSMIFVGMILLGIAVLFYFFYREIASIVKGMPSFSENLISTIQNLVNSLEDYGIHIPMIDQTQIHSWISGHMDVISKALMAFGKNIGTLFLVCVYLFFILYYRDNYLYYMRLRDKTNDGFELSKKRTKDVVDIINNFLFGLFAITLIFAIMLYVIFLLIGMKYALFFAVLVAILSLIPYIGTPVGMVIVLIFASISNEGLTVPLLALAGMIISNTLKSNVFKPIIIGNKMDLNAFVIFLSVIIGGLIWGVSGMILFMPFAGIAKILLESNERTKPLAALFTILPKDVLNQSNTSKE